MAIVRNPLEQTKEFPSQAYGSSIAPKSRNAVAPWALAVAARNIIWATCSVQTFA